MKRKFKLSASNCRIGGAVKERDILIFILPFLPAARAWGFKSIVSIMPQKRDF